MTDSGAKRIFFALWPDEEVRRQLLNCRSPTLLVGPQSRFVAAANLHLTLHYIGAADSDCRQCIRQAAAQLQCSAFELEIDARGYFPKTDVVWVGSARTSEALHDLHHRLGVVLTNCGFSPEARPYIPHITLARKVTGQPSAATLQRFSWAVNEFVLLESNSGQDGVRYAVLNRFALH